MYDCTAMLGVAGLSAGVSAARAVGEGFCLERGFAGRKDVAADRPAGHPARPPGTPAGSFGV